ncbi:MAG: recombinase family protein [Ruminococcaceae bacterium]|nr:recombinase family protein [Oscillospiraceae bacterium]
MVYGYARVSTAKQSIERQIRNIKEYDRDALIIQEKFTGTTLDRPEWRKLMKNIKPTNTIVFDEVSRMSRDADEGFEEYERLFNLGVNLVFLRQQHINTATYRTALNKSIEMTGNEVADIYLEATNRVLMLLAKNQIKLAFEQSELEIQQLHTRTKQGIETARLNGKQIGQKSGAKLNVKKAAPAKAAILKHSKHFNGTLNDKECMLLAKISRGTFYKYLSELLAEQERDSLPRIS